MIALALAAALLAQDPAKPVYDDASNLVAVIAACDEVLPSTYWEETRRDLAYAFNSPESEATMQEAWEAHRVAVTTRYSPTERRTHFTNEVCVRRIGELRASIADGIWRLNRQAASHTTIDRPSR